MTTGVLSLHLSCVEVKNEWSYVYTIINDCFHDVDVENFIFYVN